jgi:hypothetical protein
MQSGRQRPLTWNEALPSCILPDRVWKVCGLELNQPLTAEAVGDLRDRVIRQTSLTSADVDRLCIRDASGLVDDGRVLEPEDFRYVLLAAWSQASLLWFLARKEGPIAAPIEVVIEEFAAAHRRAINLPAPWQTMLAYIAVAKTWQALREAGYGRGDLSNVWHTGRPRLAALADEYKDHDDFSAMLEKLKKGPPAKVAAAEGWKEEDRLDCLPLARRLSSFLGRVEAMISAVAVNRRLNLNGIGTAAPAEYARQVEHLVADWVENLPEITLPPVAGTASCTEIAQTLDVLRRTLKAAPSDAAESIPADGAASHLTTNYDRLSLRLIELLNGNSDALPLPSLNNEVRDEQRITLAVCKATKGMTPEYWKTLGPVAREPWLVETIAALEQPGRDLAPAPNATPQRGESDADHLPPQRPGMWYRGNRVYQVAGCEPVAVTTQEDTVLQAFLETPAMDDETLVDRSGYGHAAKILRGLAAKYAGFDKAIRLPGGKGQGGYYIDLKDASKKERPEAQ